MLFIGCSFSFVFKDLFIYLRCGGVFVAARELSLVVVLGFSSLVASVPAEPGL